MQRIGLGLFCLFGCGGAAAAAGDPAAETVVLGFDSAAHAGPDFAPLGDAATWSEEGYTVALRGGGVLGTWGRGSPSFKNDPALGASASPSEFVLTQQGGQPFDLISMDVLDYMAGQAPASVGQGVTFYGFKPDGSIARSVFTFATPAYDREAHRFDDTFRGVVSVRWNENGPGLPVPEAGANRVHFIDNIRVSAAAPRGADGLRIVAFGDSTTAARVVGAASAGRPEGTSSFGLNADDPSRPPHNRLESVDAASPQLYVYSDVLRDELAARGVKVAAVDNEGIGSNRTDHAVARVESDVLAKRPDIVVLQYGINDSWTYDRTPEDAANADDGVSDISVTDYRANLEKIVRLATDAGARVILMSPNMQAEPYEAWRNTRLFQYVLAMESLYADASREGLAVDYIDVWQMNEDHVARGGALADLLLDGQHPSALGHRLEAEAVLRVLGLTEPE